MTDCDQSSESTFEYLAIRNWQKFQPKLKNGKPRRDWIRIDTNMEDDPDFNSLTGFERGLLVSIWMYTGRSGRWIRNEVTFISSATHAALTDRPHIHHAIGTLISRRFLVLCNQPKVEEFALQDKTGQDIPPTPPKGGSGLARKKREDEPPPFWIGQVLKVSIRTHEGLTKAYPAIEPEKEYAKADVWLVTNPGKRTKLDRFISNWFARAQNYLDRKTLFGGNGNGNGRKSTSEQIEEEYARRERVYGQNS